MVWNQRYGNYCDYILLRRFGLPPHGGIGAAPERILYGLLNLNHIRLTRPWPRDPGRKISPSYLELPTFGDRGLENLIEKYNLKIFNR